MNNELIALDRESLAAACGGTVATNPWAKFETDLKSRIDGLIHCKPPVSTLPKAPTTPTMPQLPQLPTSHRTHCFPTINPLR